MRKYNATEKGAAYNRAHVKAWRAANPETLAEQRKRECEYQKGRRRANPAKYKLRDWKFDLKRKYGLTPEQYDTILAKQDGKCAICKKAPQQKHRMHVDHDHLTGRNRELLCSPCNTALHRMERDLSWADAARAYLVKHAAAQAVEGVS
jgi:hypothetical protein